MEIDSGVQAMVTILNGRYASRYNETACFIDSQQLIICISIYNIIVKVIRVYTTRTSIELT